MKEANHEPLAEEAPVVPDAAVAETEADPLSRELEAAGSAPVAGETPAPPPLEPEPIEEEEEPEESTPGSRGPAGRLANVGITLVLVAALVYLARDAIPSAWVERLGNLAGLREEVSGVLHPEGDTAASQGFPESGAGPAGAIGENVAAGETLAGGASPGDTPGQTLSNRADASLGGAPASAASARTFFVNFSPDSALLEADAWHALDSVALLLREDPDKIALITDSSGETGMEPLDEEIAGARIATVEQYLQAAGISGQRLWAGERALPEIPAGPDDTGAGPDGIDPRFVFISIGSTLPP